MERYQPFDQVTRKSLDYALATTKKHLDPHQKNALLSQYNHLDPFPDVIPGLQRLKDAGYTMVIFSNGSPGMLDAIVKSTGLGKYFREVISVESVGVYKPSPKVYRHVADRLGRTIENVRLVSSNPFDVNGARNAGMQVAWIDRSGGVFDTLGDRPDMVVRTLLELGDVLGKAKL